MWCNIQHSLKLWFEFEFFWQNIVLNDEMKYINIKSWNNILLASKCRCYSIKQIWKYVFVHISQGLSSNFTSNIKYI